MCGDREIQNTEVMSTFCDKIAQACIDHFKSLPKTGKPKTTEWTVLSCIVQHNSETDTLEVVALGTGSKCIGKGKMSATGDILNDSHAEVICRRAFLRYLYENIDNEIIFKYRNLKDNIGFHFFTSHVPCGDAAIFPKPQIDEIEFVGECLESVNRKRKYEDVFRTGAKCLSHSCLQDTHQGVGYHFVGAVRTKPGT